MESALALRPGTGQERFAVGAATLSLLAAYGEDAPVAVVIDDAHWLDGSSAQALLFAFRRLVADPIAVLIAVREGETSLLDGADLPTLRVGGLTSEEATELVRGLAPGGLGEAITRLYGATGGNPLALLELAPDADDLALAPEGAPSWSHPRSPGPSCAGWAHSASPPAVPWSSRRAVTRVISRRSPGPRPSSGWICPPWLPRKARGWSPSVQARWSSAIAGPLGDLR